MNLNENNINPNTSNKKYNDDDTLSDSGPIISYLQNFGLSTMQVHIALTKSRDVT